MTNRPITTLFMLKSLDGKISTGNNDNLDILFYEDLYKKYDAEQVTIQSGGNMNGLFLRENLIDYVNVVIATLLIRGRDVPTLVDGEALKSEDELIKLRALELIECNKLNDSYVQLKCKVKK